jgi:hypothetical protein
MVALLRDSRVGVPGQTEAREYDDIDAIEILLPQAKPLTKYAFDPVALRRQAARLLADYQSQTRIRKPVASDEGHQFPARYTPVRRVENVLELQRIGQTQPSRKRGACHAGGAGWPQADRRFRPLSRRRFNTMRPLRVDIRALNPWVRLRLSWLG